MFKKQSRINMVLRCLLLFLFLITVSSAQNETQEEREEGFALTARGGALLNTHSGNFSSFEGAADCATFYSGKGNGLIGSLGYELPLSSMVHLALNLGISQRSADLENDVIFTSREQSTLQTTMVTLRNTLTTSLSYMELGTDIRPTIFERLIGGPLRLFAGARLYIPLTNTFRQSERIVSPANAVFKADNRQQREILSGEMTTNPKIGFGFSGGVENILMVSKKVGLTQQIGYDYNVSPVTNDASWNIASLHFQLGLRISFDKEMEKPIQVIEEVALPEAPLVVKKSEATPNLGIQIRSVRAKVVSGNEVLSLPPLVNSLFFDQNSSQIPERYSRETTLGNDELTMSALQYQSYAIATIVATIKANPNAKLKIIGATSGDDEGGLQLAEARAQAVKKALSDAGVAESIMRTEAKVLPENPSNQQYATGREENRRVDLMLENVQLKAYVSRRQYAEIKGEVVLGINSANMKPGTKLRLNGVCLSPETVALPADSAKMSLNCRFDKNQTTFPLEIKAASAFANASAAADVSLSEMPTETIELNLDNFKAVLRFGYDSRTLSSENKELLRQMTHLIPAGSTVTILGGADATGGEEYNRKLSQDRAEATEKFIRSIATDKFTIKTAVSTEKFAEDTPEGRFLNRNLQIRVSK